MLHVIWSKNACIHNVGKNCMHAQNVAACQWAGPECQINVELCQESSFSTYYTMQCIKAFLSNNKKMFICTQLRIL